MAWLNNVRLSAPLVDALRGFVPSGSSPEGQRWASFRTEQNTGPMPVCYRFRDGDVPQAETAYDINYRWEGKKENRAFEKWSVLFYPSRNWDDEELELHYREHSKAEYAEFGDSPPPFLLRLEGRDRRGVLYALPVGMAEPVTLRPDSRGDEFPVVIQLAGLESSMLPNGSLCYKIPGGENEPAIAVFDHRRNGGRLSQFALAERVSERGGKALEFPFINLRQWDGPREAVEHMLTADGVITLTES